MNRQLALAIQLNEQSTFSDFFWAEPNQLLRMHLQQVFQGYGERLIYIWGNSGAGKSHVLQACVHDAVRNQPAIYLPLKTLKEWGPEAIEGLDHSQVLLCIDDVDCIATDRHWEEALFHLYNRIRDEGKAVLMLSGLYPPRQLPLQLADLRSRLCGSFVSQLHELSDDAKIDALCLQAQKRGLELSRSVSQFLVTRCARNMHDLHVLLNRLDDASWMAQRKLTIPFVKSILKI
jgi:DnaA family protein